MPTEGKKNTFIDNCAELCPGIVVEDTIGKGATATVYKAKDPALKRDYALKVISDVNKPGVEGVSAAKENLKRELDCLLIVNHVNVIRLYQVVEYNDEAALLLEYACGGELFDRIVEKTCYSEHDAADTVKQILSGLQHLHEKGIVHRDLKPENLLYSNKEDNSPLKIADFGLGTIRKDGVNKMYTICGTPGYCAPEILCGMGYDEKVDVWSTGVILYILLCGYEPFADPDGNDKQMFKNILNGSYEFHSPEWDNVTESAKDMIRKMLVVNPTKRTSVRDAIHHPWLVNETSTNDLQNVPANLKLLNCKRKLKRQMHAISAVKAFMDGQNRDLEEFQQCSNGHGDDN